MSIGFLLDSKNSSSLGGKPTYLTVSEYYGDKNQIHSELANIQKSLHQEQQTLRQEQQTLRQEQETLNQQQESYRDQQEKTMNLLTNQLQQKFDLIEKKLAAQTANNETEVIAALEKKNQELENKYNTIQGKLTAKEHMYNEIAENYTKLQKSMANLEKNLLEVQTKCDAEIIFAVNKTLALGLKITQLEQLQSIKQLQTLQTLQRQVQTFDSRINLLNSHEQARNQDFLALYNLTTSSKHELENKMNNQFQTIEKNQNMSVAMLQQKQLQNIHMLHNLTSESRNENEKLANHTMNEIEQMGIHTFSTKTG
ncbi:myotubularin-related protein DDB_G0290005-like [Mytilus trossulus]|uniref:myotubularin-related protein DDB_G0290005-like n=1 Tax=Mytilus trossulus TaxID=6551 RepID=UPI0030070F67